MDHKYFTPTNNLFGELEKIISNGSLMIALSKSGKHLL